MKLKENGWYWVRLFDDDPDYKSEWQVAQHFMGKFAVVGINATFVKSDFAKIGDSIEPPTTS